VRPDDPIERLFALEQFGIKLGLDHISLLAGALGAPQDQFAIAHVAGTNGKGSVTAMVEHALRHAGYRTGRYTSPHLAHIEERIAIDGRPISHDQFRGITTDVLATADHLQSTGALETAPTFFEVTTAIAFEAFRRGGVEVAVIEVGLGGRYDATNIVSPKVTAITSIALDHQKHLGDSLASIAFEKAGILKHGVPAVVGDVQPEARSVIESVAERVGAPLVDADLRLVQSVRLEAGNASISVATPAAEYVDVRLALAGRHQVANAVVAIRTVETLNRSGLTVRHDDVLAGLTDVSWPARLEWIRLAGDRHLLLDAAHNAAGAQALAEYLLDSGHAPLPIVLAVMKDKDVASMIGALAPAAARFVATTVPRPRALPAQALADRIANLVPQIAVEAIHEPEAAVRHATMMSERAVAAGSIFLVGPLREQLLTGGALSLQGS
jgi:dihydrofolate synthase / folylpolyglutamate synthase